MIDVTHAMELAGSLKTAGEMTKAMIGIRDGAMLQSKVIELNGIILSAQGSALESNQDQFALLQRVSYLEKEVTQFKNWETEKERYVLTDYGSGTFAYALKPEKANGEPHHRLCANCFNQGHKSVLQFRLMYSGSRECMDCQRCGKEVYLGTPQRQQPIAHSGDY